MAITLGLVEAVDDNGVYLSMPGSRGVLRGPYRTVESFGVGATALIVETDGGEQVAVGCPDAGPTFNVRYFGAVGDGSTDDTSALQSAIDAAIAAAGTVVVPPGDYRTTSTLTVDGGCRIVGTGTISAVVPGTYAPAILVTGDDVVIEGITVDGNKSAFAGVTEWKHGLSLRACTNVVVRDVTATNNKGDGVLVAGDDTSGSYAEQIVLENVTAVTNHRQGLSITSAVGVVVLGGSYSDTSGTAPAAGIDVEPNSTSDLIRDIELVGVSCIGNDGHGLQVLLKDDDNQHGVRVHGGRFADNDTGVMLYGAVRDVTVEQAVIEGNSGYGVGAEDVSGRTALIRGLKIDGNLIRQNQHRGISIVMATAPAFEGLVISRNSVLDNTLPYVYDFDALYDFDLPYDGWPLGVADSGIRVDAPGPVVTMFNRVANTGVGDQEYGITTSSAVTSELHVGNDLSGNASGESVFSGTLSARTVISPSSLSVPTLAHTGTAVGFYGTTPAAKPTVSGSRGGNAALASLLTALANLGLVTDSSS